MPNLTSGRIGENVMSSCCPGIFSVIVWITLPLKTFRHQVKSPVNVLECPIYGVSGDLSCRRISRGCKVLVVLGLYR